MRCQSETLCIWKTVFISSLSVLENTRFPLGTFRHSNPWILSKIVEKLHENFESWKFFVIFSVNLRYFSLDKPQSFPFVVDCFQHPNPRPLSKFWLKFYKKVKHQEIFNFLRFLVILGYFPFKKLHLSLHKILLGSKFLPCWTFPIF